MHHISVGDLLRGLGPSGPDLAAVVKAGKVLPGDQVVPIISKHVSSLPSGNGDPKIVLLDGFPRNLEQERLARKPLASKQGIEFPDLVVYFSCPKDVLQKRYVERRRGKDDAALFEKRYEQHEREYPPVVDKYRERKILVEVSFYSILF